MIDLLFRLGLAAFLNRRLNVIGDDF